MKLKSVSGRDLGLKTPYRINLAFGFGISAIAHLFVAFIAVLFLQKGMSIEAKIPTRTIDNYQDIVQIQPGICGWGPKAPPPIVQPSAGEPVPVPDIEAPEDVDIPTCDQLLQLASYDPMDWGEGDEIVVDVNSIIDEILPPPGTFIPFEESPVPVKSVDPVYPDLARRAGLEADIWVKVLIDKNGTVRDVLISKPSEKTMGFEQAAIDAAYGGVWKPAIANRSPVAVWITYKVSFRLK